MDPFRSALLSRGVGSQPTVQPQVACVQILRHGLVFSNSHRSALAIETTSAKQHISAKPSCANIQRSVLIPARQTTCRASRAQQRVRGVSFACSSCVTIMLSNVGGRFQTTSRTSNMHFACASSDGISAQTNIVLAKGGDDPWRLRSG